MPKVFSRGERIVVTLNDNMTGLFDHSFVAQGLQL